MQVNFSILVILSTTCFLDIKAIPITNVNLNKPISEQIKGSDIVVGPARPVITKICAMGLTCTNTSDCCTPHKCQYAIGYDTTSKRCCGELLANGCTVMEGRDGKRCCNRHYCAWTDDKKTKTKCVPIIYKKKRAIQF